MDFNAPKPTQPLIDPIQAPTVEPDALESAHATTGEIPVQAQAPLAGMAEEFQPKVFSLEPGPEAKAVAERFAEVLEAELEEKLPENPLERYVAIEAVFQSLNQRINNGLNEARDGAIREILQRVHDTVDESIVALQITSELEHDDDGEARYAPRFAFGFDVPDEGGIEFVDANELQDVFNHRDDPCDALRSVTFLMVEDLDEEEAFEISLRDPLEETPAKAPKAEALEPLPAVERGKFLDPMGLEPLAPIQKPEHFTSLQEKRALAIVAHAQSVADAVEEQLKGSRQFETQGHLDMVEVPEEDGDSYRFRFAGLQVAFDGASAAKTPHAWEVSLTADFNLERIDFHAHNRAENLSLEALEEWSGYEKPFEIASHVESLVNSLPSLRDKELRAR